MFDVYMNFALIVKEKLLEDVNGKVWFCIYPNADVIIFKINFKDFKFDYSVYDVSNNILFTPNYASETTLKIKNQYKKSVLNAFFKSEKHKERDEIKKLGIYLEEL